ncbi:MAG: 3,4-dihydroxy-2-butanone-4-phosphate synthase [Janthinobacterium lividum]
MASNNLGRFPNLPNQCYGPVVSGFRQAAAATEPLILDTIADAIAETHAGRLVIVVDDEDRENEGDMICAAGCITPELVNFMVKYGRDLLWVWLAEACCQELQLPSAGAAQHRPHQTAFTVLVDLMGPGCGTGVSASGH